jgi:type III pantothenate kinase
MELFLDIGNTSVKWCLEGDLSQYGQCENSHLAATIVSILDQNEVTQIYLSNVGRRALLDVLVLETTKRGVKINEAKVRGGCLGVMLKDDYENQIGVDRWLSIAAARNITQNAFCVIDFGTTVTLDAVTEEGLHLGGLIFPGAHLIQKTIIENTQINLKLGTPSLARYDFPLATSTMQALDLLPSKLLIPAIKDSVKKVIDSQKNIVNVYVTGQIEKEVIPYLSQDAEFHKGLVLQGLKLYSKI